MIYNKFQVELVDVPSYGLAACREKSSGRHDGVVLSASNPKWETMSTAHFDPFLSPAKSDRREHFFTSPTGDIALEFSEKDDDIDRIQSPNNSLRISKPPLSPQRSLKRSPNNRSWSGRGALSPQAQKSIASLGHTTSSPTAYRLAALSALSKDGAINEDDKVKLKERIILGACPTNAQELAVGEGLDHAFHTAAREGQIDAIEDVLASDSEGSQVPRLLRFRSVSDIPVFGTPQDLQDFLCRPLPRHIGIMKLRIYSVHHRKGPYYCFHEASGRILMEGRIQRTFMSKQYRVWMCVGDRYIDEVGRGDTGVAHSGSDDLVSLGVLRPNGNKYSLHDDGEKPGKAAGIMTAREEHGLFIYEKKLARSPRNLTAVLPNVNYRDECRTAFRPMRATDTLEMAWAGGKCRAALVNNRSGSGRLLTLNQRQPSFDKVRKKYSLDFRGRCRYPSEKNFMVVDPYDSLQTVVLFGSMTEGGEEFSLDLCFPSSVFQAFGMALSQLDSASWADIR